MKWDPCRYGPLDRSFAVSQRLRSGDPVGQRNRASDELPRLDGHSLAGDRQVDGVACELESVGRAQLEQWGQRGEVRREVDPPPVGRHDSDHTICDRGVRDVRAQQVEVEGERELVEDQVGWDEGFQVPARSEVGETEVEGEPRATAPCDGRRVGADG